jgi:hypothetical protein
MLHTPAVLQSDENRFAILATENELAHLLAFQRDFTQQLTLRGEHRQSKRILFAMLPCGNSRKMEALPSGMTMPAVPSRW